MTKKMTAKSLDEFFADSTKWQEAYLKLREIFKQFDLTEELKWGKPCYTLSGENVALIHGFKDYCAILFINGAVMRDPKGLLIQQTKNVQAGRQMRFTSAKQITAMESGIIEYITDAIAAQKEGRKTEFKKTDEYEIPNELTEAFATDPAFRDAFYSLTPGRQRGYLYHFSSAKQSTTRAARIEKYRDKIFDGIGFNDR